MKWTEEVIFNDGDSYFADVLRSFYAANHSINVETYIFDRDSLGKQVLKALILAVQRGVKVRLLLDGFGCLEWNAENVQWLRDKGVEVEVFHPLPWYDSPSLAHSLAGVAGTWDKVKKRNHRKTIVVDKEIAYCGSLNVTGRHCRSVMGMDAFRDTAVRVRGPGLSALLNEFNWTWKMASYHTKLRPPKLAVKSSIVRANSSHSNRRKLYKDLFHRIMDAKHTVWITTAYFVPRVSLIYALRHAARNNVDIRILLPSKSDIGPFSKLTHNFYETLLKNKIRIFEYQPSTLHAKVCLVDDWLTVGSTNLNYRSLVFDYELDVVLSNPESIAAIKDQFKNDLKKSIEVNASKWHERAISDKIVEKILLPFKGWS